MSSTGYTLGNPPPGLGRRRPKNETLLAWIEQSAELCEPDDIFWCDGSEVERAFLLEQALKSGVLIQLDQKKLPNCYYHRSNPNDVARVEQCTFICTGIEEEAGPTNNWAEPREMHRKLKAMLTGAMHGRTMFVVPYLMGPPNSPLAKVGIELTDSIYVVLNMGIMSRMGTAAYEELDERDDFNRGLHSLLDMNPERRIIAHFPQENAIISVGSGYGGNVLLGKKCLALRIGSYLGRREGWMAEHMLLLCVESPAGEKTYVAAAFPSACGKTNFAMLIPPPHFAGWKVTTIGDDIAWMRPGPDGRLYAVNPEAGYFGVVPGTNSKSNANAMKTIARDTIYTNVALRDDNTVWWEGHDDPPPASALDWRGNRWTPDSKEKAAHPNSRFTAPMKNNPALAAEAEVPGGVPISAIIFGGRRATTVPLIYQAFNWTHGVYLGATMGSETTAAAVGASGQVRRDPMAMLPFCGYNMGRYFRHWLQMGKRLQSPPLVFGVNWFRKDGKGQFLWPGFGENMRVLKWIVDRCHGRVAATESPVGWVPNAADFDLDGLRRDFDEARFAEVQCIDRDEWRKELLSQDELYMKLYDDMPKEMIFERELLIARL
ncbi:MAG: phosphoenolpyruvate carboxykinase (GTP) [Verrucomicrobiota bacterium]|nr:phosphoenolpyruvate carboxykinase (GTP) [Verrucomicrobiota bacterium]